MLALSSEKRVRPALSAAFAALCAFATTSACVGPPGPGAATAATSSSSASNSSGSGEVSSVPYNWRSVVIEGGGFVTGLLFSPVKPGIFYARTDVGGAYRYDNGTKRWIPLTDWVSRKDATYMGIESIAPDPVNADRVYMAIGMYAQSWAGPGAFARSDDQGNTWKITPMASLKMGGNDLGRGNGERLAVDPNQPKILLFGSRLSGMWVSKDESDSWNKLESFPVKDDPKGLGIPFVIFDPSSGKPGEASKVIYAGVSRTEENLYRSTDGGDSWQPVPKQPKGFLPSRAALDKDGMLYVTYGDDPGPFAVKNGAIYRFDTKKEVWTDISPVKPSKDDAFGYGGVSVDAQHPGTLITSSNDRWGKGGEIWRSTDSGKSWKPVLSRANFESPGVVHTYHHREKLNAPQWMGDVKIDPFSSDHAATIDGGGIWSTLDLTKADKNEPTRWFFDSKNLEETCIRALISPPEGAPLLSAMGDLCGFRHDSLDESPQRGNFQNPVCASADSIDYAGKKPSVMARVGTWSWNDKDKSPRGGVSADGGATWTQFKSEPAGSNGQGTIAVSADGAVLVWAPRDAQAARSVDRGATWVATKGLPPPAKVPDWSQTSLRLAADKVNPKLFYAFDAMEGKNYVSEDGGATFTLTTGVIDALPEYNLIVASIQPVLGMEGHVWVTAGKELFQSTDAGKSYSAVGNVEEAYSVGFGAAAPGQKYPAVYLSGKVGGVTGFFRSDDAGASFVRINDDQHQYGGSNVIMGDARVYGRVYVSPGGRGILVGEPAK